MMYCCSKLKQAPKKML